MYGYAGPKPGPAGAGATVAALAQRIRVTRTGTLSLSSGVAAEVLWTVETFKNQFTHSTVTDPQDITVDVTGYYNAALTVVFTFDGTAVAAGLVAALATIYVNGSSRSQGRFAAGGLTTELTLSVSFSDLLSLTAGDVVTVEVSATFAGGAVSIITGTATHLALSRQS